MPNVIENAAAVIEGMRETLNANGFKSVKTESENEFAFESEKGTIKITADENKIYLFSSDLPYSEAVDENYKRIALSLLDENSTAGDINYIAADFNETVNEKFAAKKQVRRNNFKAPQTISKTAVRSGGMSYDTNTLASRICIVYPELKEYYKENISKYGELLGEEFFTEHANAYIVDTIKKNNPATMKKLFNVLNDIYDNGSDEVQDVVAVTILGALNNDQILLANCVDYMSDALTPVAISINKYLASSKKARNQLKNPPPYKPKKDKNKKSSFANKIGM